MSEKILPCLSNFFLKLEINLLWWERRENCLLIIYHLIGLRTPYLIFMGDCKVKVLTLIAKQWTRFGKAWCTWSPTMSLGQQEFLPLRQDGWAWSSWEGGRAIHLEQSVCDSQAGRGLTAIGEGIDKTCKMNQSQNPRKVSCKVKIMWIMMCIRYFNVFQVHFILNDILR